MHHVLAVETWQFDPAGIITRSWHVPYAAVAVDNHSTQPITATSGPPAASAPSSGQGVAVLPGSSAAVCELAGRTLTLYGTPGDSVTLQVFTDTQPPAYGASSGTTPPPAPITESTLTPVKIDYAANFAASGSPYTMPKFTIPPNCGIVVHCATAYPANGITSFAVSDTGSHTWTTLAGPLSANVYTVTEWWFNNTGANVDITPEVTTVWTFSKPIAIGAYLISNTTAAPRIVTQAGAFPGTTTLSGIPSAVGSLFNLFFMNYNAGIVSSFVAGTTGDTSPAGYGYNVPTGGDGLGFGNLYQTAPNTQTTTAVTIGADLPNADMYAALIEFLP